MKQLRPSQLLKAVFLNFLLMELVQTVALWAPVQAGERDTLIDLSSAIARVAKQNIPAVVHIEATRGQEVTDSFMPFHNDSFFRYSFNLPRMHRDFKKDLKGAGTGMFIDGQGHILTSNHLAAGASGLLVLLDEGRKYPAKLVGADPETDLAVIHISINETYPHVTFGDSDKVGVGDWVVAIGHPSGLGHTVTQGIISAKHRKGITNSNSYQDFLQTNASINHGNGGGPLVNLSGEVIGVNSAILSQSIGYEGFGIAIPSNMATHIAKKLMAHKKVERGWLGADIQDLTPDLAKSLGWKRLIGALITHVVKGGPADMAGMKRGDMVIRYRGKEILNACTLMNEVSTSPVGQEVDTTVFRDGRQKTLRLRVGNRQQAGNKQGSLIKARLGVDVRPITSKEAQRYRVNSHQGLVIASVNADSPLVDIGFEVNDIILEIDGRPIQSAEGFVDLVNRSMPEKRIILLGLDHRSGRIGYVQVMLP